MPPNVDGVLRIIFVITLYKESKLFKIPYIQVTCLIIFYSVPPLLLFIIIHQTHYQKSDWSREFNQFTIACELDMINAISAADIAFIMSSSTSAWLLSPFKCSPQKQNG